MAQIARYIDGRPPDGLVVIAFLLIIAGLLVKAAIVPFHCWLADAHAVAPTPLCVLFSGVMVELGLYGVAGGVFYGLGDPPGEDPRMAAEANEETGETDAARQRTPLSMSVPAAVLVLLALAAGVAGLVPRFADAMEAAAIRFQDQPGYMATVLNVAHVARAAPVAPVMSAM